MARLVIRGLSKHFGRGNPVAVLNGISLDIDDGEMLVLLGPSGGGKTTLLRSIAGLERPTAGSISIAGRTVVDVERGVNVPPHKRRIGMVFQNYALWPHMTVLDNVAYPMRARGMPRREAWAQAEEILRMLQCDHLLGRYPWELSGGQQQRVALGRGLAGSPETVLFDEPLSNLDAQLRRKVRSDIHRLHRELSFTAVYVTHDLMEAVELGNRIAVMRDGVVEQIGPPSEVYEHPRTPYVAQFFGVENKITCEWKGSMVCSHVAALDGAWDHLAPRGSGIFEVFVRASALQLVDAATAGSLGAQECRIRGGVIGDVLYSGGTVSYVVDCGPVRFTSSVRSNQGPFSVGQTVDCVFQVSDAFVYPRREDGVEAPAEAPASEGPSVAVPAADKVVRP